MTVKVSLTFFSGFLNLKSFKILMYYSMLGHVERLAQEIKTGADSVPGVPETLSTEELEALRAPPKSDVPIITRNELRDADGFVFGFPTRFGMMAAQFQAFLDSIGLLWDEEDQFLEGKPAGMFFSTGCQGGGQETTALTAIPQLVNHGLLFVPILYTLGAGISGMFEIEEVRGGSPFGSGTYAGTDGKRNPTEIELRQAFHQGKCIAAISKKLKRDPQNYLHNIARRW
ncbi:putative NAD(P)H dehydrogenase (quinone) FQR1-like 1 [Glycine max]|nr:putative NAD(P)H dehydrogenase (quinone) FQR1-like 1 [Glycine max]